MDSIVVGYDGSQPSSVALDWAAARAAERSSSVDIVSVNASDLFDETIITDVLQDAERRFRDVAKDAHVQSRRVSGRMPGALLRAAETADLLVIGAHRRRPLRAALTGWRPLRTIARSRVPVVVVPDDWAATDGRVLVGVDDDDSSSAAIHFAAREARAAGVGLTLVHAWQMPVPTMDGAVAVLASPIEQKAAHRRILDAAGDAVLAEYPDVAVERMLVHDNPPAALLTEARRSALLVIGTHHRGPLEGALLGSTGQDTVAQSRIPVCVVPRPEKA
ncbi:universal stress protein [Microbacterium lacus]|uniref:universal stress protein n=1 Tax=Microbacterium lacus TaxID=415217 RepID=UPI000C2BBD26|nr:universal stress protein [Microbacterium lacus]